MESLAGRFFHSRLRLIAAIGLTLAIAGISTAGCSRKYVRVKVSPEDIVRANVIATEADVLIQRKDFYAALIKYLEAARLNPNNEYILNKLGIAHSRLEHYDEAVEALKKSIWLNHKYPYPVNNLGAVYFARRDLNKAKKYFIKAISLKGDEASFHMNLGSVYFEKKNYENAMTEWRKALSLNPDVLARSDVMVLSSPGDPNKSKERIYFTARLYASQGDVLNAIKNLDDALKNGFSDLEAIQKERDFDRIRQDERFIEFMKSAGALLEKLESR